MTKRLSLNTAEKAIAYLTERGVNVDTAGDDPVVVVSRQCSKCGGYGRGNWRPHNGICFACGGERTIGKVDRVPVIDYAKKTRAKELATKRRQAKRAKAHADRLDRQRDWCESQGHGRITYEELRERRAAEREAKKAAERAKSDWIGEIKERRDFADLTVVFVTSWDTAYGTTSLYKMKDNDGNVIVWKSSVGMCLIDDEGRYICADKGDTVTIKATIKDHDEYKGEKQTIVTRAKVLSLIEAGE